jgi:hypothetical protein
MSSFNHLGDDWGDEETDSQPQSAPTPLEVVVEQATAASSVEDIMSEAERRFAKAKYYEILIKQSIFDSDESPNATDVTKEIQDFARDRLTILLGLKSEKPVESVFSDEEVLVLKKLVAKLLKKPEIAGIPPPEPVLRRSAGPTGPTLNKTQQAAPKAAPVKPLMKSGVPIKQTTEVVKIPQKDGTTRSYTKVLGPKNEVWYLGANGQRYSMEQNEAGDFYMKSLSKQSKPQNAPKGVPQLNSAMMAAVAADQVSKSMNQNPLTAGAINTALVTSAGTQE